jgi:membrane associated rhomboid family serine protease
MVRDIGRGIRARVWLLGLLVGAMWIEEIIDQFVFHGALDRYGIRPRVTTSLWDIAYAPFLHASFTHLLANTVPLVVLGALVLMRPLREFLVVTVFVVVVSGLGVWLFGRPNTVHLGASGLVFGYLGYLLLRSYFERSVSAIAVALVVAVMYGGALWGMLPVRRGVSWEGHIFGFTSGAASAGLVGSDQRRRIASDVRRRSPAALA